MKNHLLRVFNVFLLIFALILLRDRLVASAYVNIGALFLERYGLVYWRHNTVVKQSLLIKAEESFEQALRLFPHNLAALRGWAQVKELDGRYDEALVSLEEIVKNQPGDILTSVRILETQSRLEEQESQKLYCNMGGSEALSSASLSNYMGLKVRMNTSVSAWAAKAESSATHLGRIELSQQQREQETILHSLLSSGLMNLQGNNKGEARSLLLNALSFDAENFASIYWLSRLEGKTDPRLANPVIRPIEDSDLARLQAVALANGAGDPFVWRDEFAVKVIEFLGWHGYPDLAEVAINARLASSSSKVPWMLYLGEVYNREGRWAESVDVLDAVIRQPSPPPSAYLALARAQIALSEKEGSRMSRDELRVSAMRNLEMYRQLAPADLKGLILLANLRPPSYSANGILYEEIKERMCDEYVVADVLGLEAGQIKLGRNLLANFGFEIPMGDWHGWSRLIAVGLPYSAEAAFEMGIDDFDSFEGQRSARLVIFWIRPDAGPEKSRIGYRANPISLAPHTCYLTTFAYKTNSNGKGDSVTAHYTGGESDPKAYPWVSYLRFPVTNGAWRKVSTIGCNSAEEYQSASFQLIAWGPVDAQFDSVAIKPLNGVDYRTLTNKQPLVIIK